MAVLVLSPDLIRNFGLPESKRKFDCSRLPMVVLPQRAAQG